MTCILSAAFKKFPKYDYFHQLYEEIGILKFSGNDKEWLTSHEYTDTHTQAEGKTSGLL